MPLRFFAMRLEGLLELGRLGRLRHLGQCLQDLLLGIVDVLEHVMEHVIEGLWCIRSHWNSPVVGVAGVGQASTLSRARPPSVAT